MIFVDTGYLIALSDPADSLHLRANAWSKVLRVNLLITEYVLLETINHFSLPIDRLRSHVLLQHIRSSVNWIVIPASPSLFDSGISLHASRPDKEWSLTDCISFIVMEEHGVSQALAYDHHFEQAGFEALLRREP